VKEYSSTEEYLMLFRKILTEREYMGVKNSWIAIPKTM